MIRVALLGAGIGREHMAAYEKLPKYFNVLYVVDRDLDRARDVASDTSARPVADIETALNDPDIDCVDVCLPPHLHVPVTLDALTAKKDVICEKPLCTALSDVDRLRDACRQADGLERHFASEKTRVIGNRHHQTRATKRIGG